MTNEPVPQKPSNEIDLGQLFQTLGRGFNQLGRLFLRFFAYVKKQLLILVSLVVVGLGIGFWLNWRVPPATKVVVLVRPYLDSENYLYELVAEIDANVQAKNSSFFTPLGIAVNDVAGFEISVEAVDDGTFLEDDALDYLPLLQKLEDAALVADIVQKKVLDRNRLHAITFRYSPQEKGYAMVKRFMEYINSNPYYTDLMAVQRENFREAMAKNEVLIAQIDTLVGSYSQALREKGTGVGTSLVVASEEFRPNSIFEIKRELLRDIAQNKMALQVQTKPVSILSFGKPQPETGLLSSERMVSVPLVLLGVFFLVAILRILNRKAKHL